MRTSAKGIPLSSCRVAQFSFLIFCIPVNPLKEGALDTYLLYCVDVATQSEKMPNLNPVLPVQSESMGAAINTACTLMLDGVVVWKIKGPNGFIMERSDIETECLRRHGAQLRPKRRDSNQSDKHQ